MKFFKRLLIGLLILLAIPFLMALFVTKQYDAVREIVIHVPKDTVFNYVKYLKNQDNYSKWAAMDPNMNKSYRGIDGTVGFVSAWSSTNEDVGAGEQEIKKIVPGERIDYELRFIEPFQSTEPAFMSTVAIDSATTKVTWGFHGEVDYPMNIIFLFMDFEKMIGDDLEIGLSKLKIIMEQP